ncbi:MAG: hypothetical protein A2176_00030 [Spirochaetes bacterium RBG_13_51_14]|nr:MAG: hypothetical protein A2176_00030 [Spirochaetes bacterium RBG_13_51_14]
MIKLEFMERNNGIDFVRGLAIINVVAAHCAFYRFSSINLNFFINTIGRFTVPFFFVSTGYLLYIKLQSTNDKNKYFISFINRALRVFIFFTVLCFFMDVFFYMVHVTEQIFYFDSFLWNAGMLIFMGMFSISSVPLWYVFAVALSVLMIYIVNRKKSNTTILLLISLILNLIGLFGLWQAYSVFVFLVPFFTRIALFFGLFYITLGYFIAEKYDKVKDITKGFNYPAMAVLSLVLLIVERSFFLLYYKVGYGEYYISSIPLAFFSMMYIIEKNKSFKESFVTKIGKNLVGIYVFHIFYLTIFKNCILIFYKPGETFLSDLLSLLITFPVIYLSNKSYLLLEKTSMYQRFIIRKEIPIAN